MDPERQLNRLNACTFVQKRAEKAHKTRVISGPQIRVPHLREVKRGIAQSATLRWWRFNDVRTNSHKQQRPRVTRGPCYVRSRNLLLNRLHTTLVIAIP